MVNRSFKSVIILSALIFSGLFVFSFVTQSKSETTKKKQGFSQFVDENGEISLPQNIRTNWEYLGAWVVPELPDGTKTDGYGFHDVLASPGTTKAYREAGKFADGSVLVKQIRSIKESALTTGPKVLSADDELVWFVMIKDKKGRFQDNPNWGDGWGWALFKQGNKTRNVSTDYKKDCLGCHVPAKSTDWVYVDGYPTLKK